MIKKSGIVLIAIVVIMMVVGIYLIQKEEANPQTKDEAIQQAQEYQPKGACTQALVRAIHKDTGAKYTFNSGCLAPGWVPER
jgi:hypothetical protein